MLVFLATAVVPRVAQALEEITEEEAEPIACAVVRRLGGVGELPHGRGSSSAVRCRIDNSWYVTVDAASRGIFDLYNLVALGKRHWHRDGFEAISDDTAVRMARNLVARAVPDFDLSGFQLERVRFSDEPGPRACVVWRKTLKSGFPAPALCQVDFCWVDGTVLRLRAYDPPVKEDWNRPPIASAEEVQRRALDGLDLPRWVRPWVQTRKALADAEHVWAQPVWETVVHHQTGGPKDEWPAVLSVYTKPWAPPLLGAAKWTSLGRCDRIDVPAEARIDIGESALAARRLVRRLGGDAEELRLCSCTRSGAHYRVDNRWHVSFTWDGRGVRAFDSEPFSGCHVHPDAGPKPSSAELQATARRLLVRALPDTDLRGYELKDIRGGPPRGFSPPSSGIGSSQSAASQYRAAIRSPSAGSTVRLWGFRRSSFRSATSGGGPHE